MNITTISGTRLAIDGAECCVDKGVDGGVGRCREVCELQHGRRGVGNRDEPDVRVVHASGGDLGYCADSASSSDQFEPFVEIGAFDDLSVLRTIGAAPRAGNRRAGECVDNQRQLTELVPGEMLA